MVDIELIAMPSHAALYADTLFRYVIMPYADAFRRYAHAA